MRQRRIKNIDEKLARAKDIIIQNPEDMRGHWREDLGASARVFCEIGCGKGKFICEHAEAEPGDIFIGIEGQDSVIIRVIEKVRERDLKNVRLIACYVSDMREFFADGELDGIYLNFSDPWPKARHAKRRLTHRDKLAAYMSVIKPGGFVEFKTDNPDLFDFTIAECDALGYNLVEISRDLENSEIESRLFRSEYEEKFSAEGIAINYLKIRREAE